jgi:hypothetical protein
MRSSRRSPRRWQPDGARGSSLGVGVSVGVALILTGCGTALDPSTGSGSIVESDREVDAFETIEVDGPLAVSIVTGDETAVLVRTDDNLQQQVLVDVDDAALRLTLAEPVRTDTLEVQVTVPARALTGVQLDGAASLADTEPLLPASLKLVADGASRVFVVVDTPMLGIEANDASVVNVAGSADLLEVNADGASSVEVGELEAGDATVSVRGASRATVQVSGALAATAAGASTVEYDGDPEVTSDADASSTVRAR